MAARIGKSYALKERRSLPEELAEIIIYRIETGEFKLGDVLPSEQALADLFKVSRTVVREALARLKYEGLIHSKRGSGPIVSDIARKKDDFNLNVEDMSIEKWSKFLEFRLIMEGETAALAALHRSEEQLAQLKIYLDLMAAAVAKGESGTEPDYLFHCLTADCSGNEYLGDFSKYVSSRLWKGVYRARSLSNLDSLKAELVWEEHKATFKAIEDKDAHMARAMAQRHLLNSAARQNIKMDTRFLAVKPD